MQNVAFKAGDTIICEGDEGDTAFFIVSGAVDVAVGRGAMRKSSAGLRSATYSEKCA